MPTATDTILFEMDGRTAKLAQAVEDARARLKLLEGSAASASAAGDAIGQRYAGAATQIAGASAQVANMGRVTTESAKQVITQAAGMATAFGPTGAFVSAIGVATLAIVTLWQRSAEESKKAREQMESDFRRIRTLGVEGAAAEMEKLYSGADPRGAKPELLAEDAQKFGESFGIKGLKERVELLKQNIQFQNQLGTEAREFVGDDPRVVAQIKAFEAEITRLEALHVAARSQLIYAGAKADERSLSQMRADARDKRAAAEKEAALRTAAAWEQATQRQTDFALNAWNRASDAIAKMLGMPVDDIARDLAKAEQEAAERGDFLAARSLAKKREAYELEKQRLIVAHGLELATEAQAEADDVVAKKAKEAADIFAREQAHARETNQRLDDELAQNLTTFATTMEGAFLAAFAHIAESGKATFGDLFAFASDALDAIAKKHAADDLANKLAQDPNYKGAGSPGFAGALASVMPVYGAAISWYSTLQQQRDALTKSLQDYSDAFFDFIRGIHHGGDTFADTVARINDTFAEQARELMQRSGMGEGPGRTSEAWHGYWEALDAAKQAELDRLEAVRQKNSDMARDDLQVATLRLQGHDREADALAHQLEFAAKLKAFTDGAFDQDAFTALFAWNDAWNQWAAEAQAAADRLKASTQLDVHDELYDITDPAQKIQERVALFQQEFGDLFAGILDDVDLGTTGGLDTFTQRLQALFESLDPDNLPPGIDASMFDEIIAAILGLETAADQAAAGIVDAAQQMAAAVSQFKTGAQILGITGTDYATGLASTYGIDIGDVSTQAGRDAAKQTLRDLYRDHPELGQTILDIIGAIDAIPADGATGITAGMSGATSAAASSSSSSSTTSFAARATVEQADRLIGLSQSQLSVQREIRDAIRYAAGLGALATPALPSMVSVSGGITVQAQYINVAVHTDNVGAHPELTAREIAARIYPELVRLIARDTQRQARSSGTDSLSA